MHTVPAARQAPRRNRALAGATQLALGASVALAITLSVAFADVDVEVRAGDRVSGTLDPATEVESISAVIPAGAKVTVRAAGTKSGPAIGLELYDGGGMKKAEAVPPSAKSKAAKISKFVATPGGTYTARVRSLDGATTGDYTGTIVWTPVRKFGPTLVSIHSEFNGSVEFSGEAGAKVRVTVAAAKGSAARPRLRGVTGPLGDIDTSFFDGVGGSTDRSGAFVLPATGTYSVFLIDSGDVGGDVNLTVQLTPPKPSKRKVDIRAASIGTGGTDDGAYARVVGPEGGTVEVPSDLEGLAGIAGSSISVPTGALPTGVTLVIGTSTAFDIAGLDERSLGAAVLFGPEGTTFGTKTSPVNATITIPVDLSTIAGDSSLVQVWVRDAKGNVSKVTAALDFSRPGYVSFPTPHFSAYRAVTVAPPAALNPITLATVTGGVDIEPANGVAGAPNGGFLVAGGFTRVVRLVANPAPGSGSAPSVSIYAGGGADIADGTDRTLFNFQGDLTSVTTGANGDVYVATATRVFRVVGATGAVTRIAGTGVVGDSGDGGPATSAQFTAITDILAPLNGDVFILDGGAGRVRRVASGGVSSILGTGTLAFGTDGVAPVATTFLAPTAMTFRPTGGFLVCDAGRLRAINTADSTNTTVLGDSGGGTGTTISGLGPLATQFRSLSGVSVTPGGVIYVADEIGHTISKYDPGTGLVTVVIGTPDSLGTAADGAAAPFAITAPLGVLATTTDILFLEGDRRVRRFVP
ncbi:MAG: hypothetical protein K8T90_11125 [Planctomycetes bacterium]|nr:hypothetical protein [Planctomycetota bacterium]